MEESPKEQLGHKTGNFEVQRPKEIKEWFDCKFKVRSLNYMGYPSNTPHGHPGLQMSKVKSAKRYVTWIPAHTKGRTLMRQIHAIPAL